ncbi:alpha-L-fucosidase [Hufsiella ginkgonis]|uniref:alpha-L-fucosidase n=1 Tax=Hufsiella ginkgonis TaxID=2695274 RepID=A0A7K1Y342_9SPHI|nr:alpha-L-fucosidase [Hufsiella ginkgonis]MXV17652.1 alpha-L-fucosidase [Hufsiella ginkgonis]
MKKQLSLLLLAVSFYTCAAQPLPKPAPRQLEWQQMETTAFLHFTVNTFTDKEWGDGTESPSIFNPVDFDAKKIVRILKETGFRQVIITAKHHDGFCLWPSKYTSHSVKSSPWKNGKGDVVREIADACREYGVKFGFYLSPWDRHEPSYGTAAYNAYYKNQLRELLTNYGEVYEVWFDGAKGKDAKDMEYDFKGYWQMVRELQPKAVLFSDAGPDVRWVGNEKGFAGLTCWSTINASSVGIGKAGQEKYLNEGDPNGTDWVAAEADVSIRKGWFYHAKEDSTVRTGQALADLYYRSVGRNSLLLLNIPPNPKGLLGAQDVKSLVDFRNILDETFKLNLASGKADKKLVDEQLGTYVTLNDKEPITIDFKQPVSFDRAMFQENIADGQRNEEALLEYWDGAAWQKIEQFTTIGYKRLLRFPLVKTTRVRFTVLKAKQPVQLAAIGFYKASGKE